MTDDRNESLSAAESDDALCERFDKRESAGYLANHMARLFAQALARKIGPLGLSPGQFPVLLELWQNDGLSQRQLVERLDVEQATMANTLTRMERDGLVTRRRDPRDKRVLANFLTPKAKKLRAPAITAAFQVNQQAYSGLSAADCDKFIALTKNIIASLRDE